MSKKGFYENINGVHFCNNKLVGGWQRLGARACAYRLSVFVREWGWISVGARSSRHSFWRKDDERLVPLALGTRSGSSRRSHSCSSGGGRRGEWDLQLPTTFIKSQKLLFFSKGLPSTGFLKLVHKKKICLPIVILELAPPSSPTYKNHWTFVLYKFLVWRLS